jgi:hypothetical protein
MRTLTLDVDSDSGRQQQQFSLGTAFVALNPMRMCGRGVREDGVTAATGAAVAVVTGSDVAGTYGAGNGVAVGSVSGGGVVQSSVKVLEVLQLLLLDGMIGIL